MFSETLRRAAGELLDRCKKNALTLATAESCTGGLIASLLTELPGSSAVFERGFVTYSNAAKTELLGVDATLIAAQGAVSEPVALAMARGALVRARVPLAVSVTGIAGPDGGSAGKPVGLVYTAVASETGDIGAMRHQFSGDRAQIRLQAVEAAIRQLISFV